MKSQQVRLALTGLALGVLLALLIAPQTRWLGRLQILTVLRLYHPLPGMDAPMYTQSQAEDDRRIQDVAVRHPEDYALQYAAVSTAGGADRTGGAARVLSALHALTARFPDQPALYAAILRAELRGNIRLARAEGDRLLPKPSYPEYHPHPSAPADLATYDRAAAAGERLDPDNAYFPLLRAVGLFAAHRDAEGLAAALRASQEPGWQEYYTPEVEARWQLHAEAFGDPSGLGRTAAAAAELLPEYGPLRGVALLVLYHAVQAEQAGRAKEGLKLREALRRVGDLIRVQSTYVIGALVGNAINAIATDRIGGATQDAVPGPASDQQMWQGLDAYRAYATRLGHPEFAAREQAEAEAGREVSALVKIYTPVRDNPLIRPFLLLTRWWLADLAVLSNILWLLLFGGMAAGLARLVRVREAGERPTWDWVALLGRVGAACGLLLLTAFVVFLIANLWTFLVRAVGWQVWVGGLVLLLLTAFVVLTVFRALLRMRGSRRQAIFWTAGILLLAGAGLFGFWHLALWQSGSLSDLADGQRSLLGVSSGGDDAQQASAHWLALAAVFASPLLLILVSGIAAHIRRVPLRVGLVRGLAAAALPLASLLLLVWGGLLVGTLRQERVVDTQLTHSVHDEGPYLAAQAGQSWPGPVR